MNVVVSNRQKEIIDNANIDAIKDLNGLFNVDDLISKFKNYFFSKMILDATSVVNFATKEVLTKLATEIGADKLVILLPSTPEPPLEFKQLLIDLKIYNFSNKIEDVIKFIDNPNTYEKIMDSISNTGENSMYIDNSVKDGEDKHDENNNVFEKNESASLDNMLNNFSISVGGEKQEEPSESYQEEKEDTEENKDTDIYTESNNEEKSMLNLSDLVNSNEEKEEETKVEDKEEEKVESNDKEKEEEKDVDAPSLNRFLITDGFDDTSTYEDDKYSKRVIGIKNITDHAGSTSLVYALRKLASDRLKKSVLGIELNNHDFRLYRDRKMISIDEKDVNDIIKDANEDVIFVDLNGCTEYDFCTDVLYLIEPSLIKLNGLMAKNKDIFKDLKNKKVILNKCMLSKSDVKALSSEAGMDFFYCIAPFNDRNSCDLLDDLLDLLDIKK